MADNKEMIHLYKAVEEMKSITNNGETFSISFRKYDRQRNTGGDCVRLKSARLRQKASDDTISHASDKLFLVDAETGRSINCWQILVVEFNGLKTYI